MEGKSKSQRMTADEFNRTVKGHVWQPTPDATSRPQPQRGTMNKTERRYADWLATRGGCWRYEPVTLRLAPGVRYTPDFVVWDANGRLSFVEIKGGFVRDDARVKFLLARKLFPEFKFTAMQWKDGEWREIWAEAGDALSTS